MEELYTSALLHFLPFGPRSNARLFAHFGSAETIWNASNDKLRQAASAHEIPLHRVEEFIIWRPQVDPAQLFAAVVRANLEVITRHNERYPAILQTIYDPPLGLFLQGNLPPLGLPLVSMVGSRHCTKYGLTNGHQLASNLVKHGLGIVSGLAMGIDECIHRATLKQGGYTLAVIAQGHRQLDHRQQTLANDILKSGGGVISEYPPEFTPQPFNFPIRNRIIAGFSKGTVIIEANLASGTLRTAQSAIDNHREVFAVPGPIDSPTSTGANRLIKDGAHIATCAEDITDALGLTLSPAKQKQPAPLVIPVGDNPTEQMIIDLLVKNSLHIDDLARAASQSSSELLATLTCLEMTGKVRHLGNMEYGI